MSFDPLTSENDSWVVSSSFEASFLVVILDSSGSVPGSCIVLGSSASGSGSCISWGNSGTWADSCGREVDSRFAPSILLGYFPIVHYHNSD